MHSDMKRVGKIIQNARLSKGLTQSALAEMTDASLRTVIAIENGKRNPTFVTVAGIVRILNIPADLIFRPDAVLHTPEQEQFFQEYLDAGNRGQKLSMAASRAIWRELRETESSPEKRRTPAKE